MIKLYLIRHGETDWNASKKFQGWSDIELNKNGLEQAKLLGERFKNIKVDEIYSSPLKRAVKTAEPLAKANGITVQTNECFKEINFGKWEGLTRDEISETYGAEFDDFIIAPEIHTFPGEISFDNVTKRIAKGLDEVLKGKNDKSIAIVSHGGIIRLMIKYLLDIHEPFYNKTWVDNTSVTFIEIGKNYNLLRVFNDSSHINNGIL